MENSQIRVFREAAAALKEERYWYHESVEVEVEFLRAVGGILTEICFHLDANDVLPLAGLKAFQDAAGWSVVRTAVKLSAELMLMTALDCKIEELIARAPVPRDTGSSRSSKDTT